MIATPARTVAMSRAARIVLVNWANQCKPLSCWLILWAKHPS